MSLRHLPDSNEFSEWLKHPVTEALFATLHQRIADLKEQWASGAFTDQSQFATAIANAKAIGNCEAIEGILSLDHEQLIGELNEK